MALAALLLAACAPVLGTAALAIALSDAPPVLFWQERVGRGGRSFRLLKFRTMRGASGPEVTAAGDRRITAVGRWLRRLKLDELPQLWNVLVGDMSLVGPRPEVPAFVVRAGRSYAALAALRPGVTDWASLAFRDEEAILARHAHIPNFYASILLPRKLALARLYNRRGSLLVDLRLIAATACIVLGLDGPMRRLAGPRIVERARRGLADGAQVRPETPPSCS